MPQSLLILLSFIALTGCEAIQVITAVDHKPEIQTPESIRQYAQKHGFDGYPILTFATSIMATEADIMLKFNMYNKEGKYLSLDEHISRCSYIATALPQSIFAQRRRGAVTFLVAHFFLQPG